ncbi:MAG TPA: tetratricopeptide repeat protein, partial [Thermoanaerobaculia bacterium]
PADIEVVGSLAQVLTWPGVGNRKAVPLYERVLANSTCGSVVHLQALSYLASNYANLGEGQKSMELLRRVTTCLPNRASADAGLYLVNAEQTLDQLAKEFRAAKKYHQAAEALKIALSLPIASNDYERLVDLGEVYEAQKRISEAEDYYLRATRAAARSGVNAERATVRLAFLRYDAANFDTAADAWERYLAVVKTEALSDAGKSLLYRFAGQIYLKAGRYDNTVKATKTALALNPRDAVAHNQLGLAYYLLGNYTAAAEALKLATVNDPANARYYNSLGNVYYESQYLERALESYRRARELEPSNPLYWTNIAACLVELARYDEAITILADAANRFPNDAEIASLLAEAYNARGFDDQARKWTNAAKRLNPTIYGDAERRVIDLEQEGKAAEGRHSLYRALREYSAACRIWAGAELRARQRQNVFRVYNRLPAKPVLPAAVIDIARRAQETLRVRNLHEAAETYEDALEIAPWWPEGYYNLALVRAAEADWRGAIANMRDFLAITSDAAARDHAHDLIEEWSLGNWNGRTDRK